jgi:hypothetical protein
VIEGLVANPSAPAEILLAALAKDPDAVSRGLHARRAELPAAFRVALTEHPSWRVRAAVSDHGPALLDDPDWRVRIRGLSKIAEAEDDHLTHLLGDLAHPPDDQPFFANELLDELFTAMRYAPRLFTIAARHPDPIVREFAARHADHHEDLRFLRADPVPEVRAAAQKAVTEHYRLMEPADLPDHHTHGFWWVLQLPLSRELIDQVLASDDLEAISWVARNRSVPPDVTARLITHPDPETRAAVAGRTDLTDRQVRQLADDPAPEVRSAMAARPATVDEHLHGRVPPLPHAITLATSADPLLRERAARQPELPRDLAAALAQDQDPGVRAELARSHPDAPPALLLRCYLEKLLDYRVLRDERFPVTGLARFADHPEPGVRLLVARDPEAGPEIVWRLCADPDLPVRRAMAACPRLPAGRVAALLDNPELARQAAANPALPAELMWGLVDHD